MEDLNKYLESMMKMQMSAASNTRIIVLKEVCADMRQILNEAVKSSEKDAYEGQSVIKAMPKFVDLLEKYQKEYYSLEKEQEIFDKPTRTKLNGNNHISEQDQEKANHEADTINKGE